MDFSAIPFPDLCFTMVIFDPPHIKTAGPESWQAKKYGKLTGDWKAILEKCFSECFRVLCPGGFLIFKWNEVQIPVSEILALTEYPPLFGHRSGKRSNTHWITFIKDHNG